VLTPHAHPHTHMYMQINYNTHKFHAVNAPACYKN